MAPPREYGPPAQVDAQAPGDYLAVITKAVFQAGMSWPAVESKWDGFREVFHEFDAEYVAALSPDDVDSLAQDTRIIRNRRKIEATIYNAETLLELDRGEGGIGGWLSSRGDFEKTLDAVRAEFKYLGDFGVYYLLYVVGEEVPEYETARALIDARR
jgi:3-methyladenine DNA glycosylase Tag